MNSSSLKPPLSHSLRIDVVPLHNNRFNLVPWFFFFLFLICSLPLFFMAFLNLYIYIIFNLFIIFLTLAEHSIKSTVTLIVLSVLFKHVSWSSVWLWWCLWSLDCLSKKESDEKWVRVSDFFFFWKSIQSNNKHNDDEFIFETRQMILKPDSNFWLWYWFHTTPKIFFFSLILM